jgi:hypothetical protein
MFREFVYCLQAAFIALSVAAVVSVTILLVATGIALVVTSCGPQFDREAMQDVKETFCDTVLEEAELAKQRGDALTPEESAAVEFCDD